MRTKRPYKMPRMVQIPLDDSDRERLARHIRREEEEGRRVKPGPAAGHLFRRGLDVEEREEGRVS